MTVTLDDFTIIAYIRNQKFDIGKVLVRNSIHRDFLKQFAVIHDPDRMGDILNL